MISRKQHFKKVLQHDLQLQIPFFSTRACQRDLIGKALHRAFQGVLF